MIIYTVDTKKFERQDMITDFKSIIWTERWDRVGDFELYLPDTARYREIVPGTCLELSEYGTSHMMIETVIRENKENGPTLVFKGRSIEVILDNIFFKKSFTLTNSPERNAMDLLVFASNFDKYLVTFARNLDINTFMPGLQGQTSSNMFYETNDNSLLKQLQDMLSVNYAGYQVLRRRSDTEPFFDIRIKLPRENNGATLSTALNDFETFSTIRSISNYRNVAWVRYILNDEEKWLSVSNPQYYGTTSLSWELSKRMILVDATSINREDYLSDQDFYDSVRTQGLIKLADYRYQYAFDGQLTTNFRLNFGRDYMLGDILPVIHDNQKFNALVTEHIWSANKDSIRKYPTLVFL